MNIVGWSPFREMDDLFSRYRQMAGPLTSNGDRSTSIDGHLDWRPVADISESKTEYVIKAELPEVEKDDLSVTVENGRVTICGDRKMEKKDEEATQHRIESFYGTFSRTFALPEDVDENAISAAVRNGVLKVHLPKSEVVESKPVQIVVE